MTDFTTTYMGLKLKSPIIAGASPMTSDLNTIKKLEEAGAGAIVCKSLFEEEIQLESLALNKELHEHDNKNPEGLTLFPDFEEKGPDYHLHWLKKTKENTNIPIIASLNAVNEDTWIRYAKKIEQTGVDAIELNLYHSPDNDFTNSSNIEKAQIETLKKIRDAIHLPISVKLNPYYTDLIGFIKKLDEIKINGFVLFNKFFQPSIDINKEEFTFPFNLSHKGDDSLALRFTGLLSRKINGSICSSNGIMDSEDVISMILAGADSVQVVSTLYKNGPNEIKNMLDGLEKWMKSKKYTSFKDFQGKMSQSQIGQKDNLAYKRAQYVKMLMQPNEKLIDKIIL